MFDMTVMQKRYFSMKLNNNKKIDVEPPTVKSLKKIMKMSKVETDNMTEEDFNGLSEGLSIALSKNKQKYKITVEYVEENFNIHEIQQLLTEYFQWVESIENQKN